MATDASTYEGRQKILEGLWLIGIEPGQLDITPGLPESDFLAKLHANGVNDTFIQRATAGVDWRAPKDNSPLDQRISDLLRQSGYRPDEVQRFLDQARLATGDPSKGISPQAAMQVLTQQFNERTAGAMVYKATGGKVVQGMVWNPFRGDQAPKGVDTKFGMNGALLPGAVGPGSGYPAQDPNAGQAGTRVPQLGQLPTPPSPAEIARQQAAQSAGKLPPTDGGLGGGGGGGGGDGGLPQQKLPTNPEEVDAWVKSHFGADAWFMDVPEIRNILTDMAMKGETDGDEAARRVSQTQWYKNTSSSARMWHINEQADPASANADVATQATTFGQMAAKLGINIAPDRLQAIAKSSLMFGWSQAQIQSALGAEYHYDPAAKEQAPIISSIKKTANDYLVPMSDETIGTWAKGLVSGQFDENQFNEYMKGQAKSLFPQLSAAIDAGHTVDDYVDPYRQIAVQTLGVPADSVNFMDPKWRAALDQVDPKTNQRTTMTLSDWTRKLKTDDTYGYDKTQNGIQDGAKVATALARTFGAIA